MSCFARNFISSDDLKKSNNYHVGLIRMLIDTLKWVSAGSYLSGEMWLHCMIICIMYIHVHGAWPGQELY